MRVPVVSPDVPRANEQIDTDTVRLISTKGKNLGILSIQEALKHAEEEGLDLVEVSPSALPPVVRIMDFGKYKYGLQKRRHETRRKQKNIDIKEIKMRPNIDSHDYGIKMRAIRRFLEEGDKVKVTLRFRGREMAYQELGHKLLDRVAHEPDLRARVENQPKLEGRQIVMILAPSR